MALSRDELIARAVTGYFGSVCRRDMEGISSLLAPECCMHVVTQGTVFEGKARIIAHFEEFLDTYPRIEIADFEPIADEAAQKAVIRFTITLQERAGQQRAGDKAGGLRMTNCNIFRFDGEGRFAHIAIYMSERTHKGFVAGAQTNALVN